jgi:hypothetical protein
LFLSAHLKSYMETNYELGWICNNCHEYLKVVSLNLLGKTEKTHGNSLSEYLILRVIFKKENFEYEATLDI